MHIDSSDYMVVKKNFHVQALTHKHQFHPTVSHCGCWLVQLGFLSWVCSVILVYHSTYQNAGKGASSPNLD